VQPAILGNSSSQADPSPNGPSPLREYWVVSGKPPAYPMRLCLIAEILSVEQCVERKCRLPRDEVTMVLLGSFKRSAKHRPTDAMRSTYYQRSLAGVDRPPATLGIMLSFQETVALRQLLRPCLQPPFTRSIIEFSVLLILRWVRCRSRPGQPTDYHFGEIAS